MPKSSWLERRRQLIKADLSSIKTRDVLGVGPSSIKATLGAAWSGPKQGVTALSRLVDVAFGSGQTNDHTDSFERDMRRAGVSEEQLRRNERTFRITTWVAFACAMGALGYVVSMAQSGQLDQVASGLCGAVISVIVGLRTGHKCWMIRHRTLDGIRAYLARPREWLP